MVEILVGIVIGIATNLAAWWFLFHLIVPKLTFSVSISKIPAPKNENERSGFKYRIKIQNSGKRGVIDVDVMARLRIRGISNISKTNWHVINMPISSEGKVYKIPRILSIKNKSAHTHTLKLLINNVPEIQHNLIYPKKIRDKAKKHTLVLEDLLSLGTESNIQIIAFGYDEFSGTRKIFVSKRYILNDIKVGSFYSKGLEVNVVRHEEAEFNGDDDKDG